MKYRLDRMAQNCLMGMKTYPEDISVQFDLECMTLDFSSGHKRNICTLWDSDMCYGISGIRRFRNPRTQCGIWTRSPGVHWAPCVTYRWVAVVIVYWVIRHGCEWVTNFHWESIAPFVTGLLMNCVHEIIWNHLKEQVKRMWVRDTHVCDTYSWLR